jgi:ribonuclease D
MSQPAEFIDTPEALDDLIAHLDGVDWMALDTEFHRERTYYAQLCLVQIATSERIACVDPLALDSLDDLLDAIYDPRRLKVLHSGRQDLELFHDLRGSIPVPVFDTQLAATLTGQGDQIGYGGLVESLCEVKLDKGHTRTDWRKRPLSEGQLTYAADDVRYLGPLRTTLSDTLDSLGRTLWFEEECAGLINPASYQNAPDEAWSRLKGVGKLRGVELNAARVIAAWREEQAIRIDKPRRWVIPDAVVLDLARVNPDKPRDMDSIEGISTPWLRRQKDTFLRLLRLAHSAPHDTWPSQERRPRLTPAEEKQMKKLQGVVKSVAAELDISHSMLATRRDLDSFLRGFSDNRIQQGWRREILMSRLDPDD